MSIGYNYHITVDGESRSGAPFQRSLRGMHAASTVDDLCAEMLKELARADLATVRRVRLSEGHRILVDWGPMHVALFRAFGDLFPNGWGTP